MHFYSSNMLSRLPTILFRPTETVLRPARLISSSSSSSPLTLEDVTALQTSWADAIVSISKSHGEGEDFVALAGEKAGELYGYSHFPGKKNRENTFCTRVKTTHNPREVGASSSTSPRPCFRRRLTSLHSHPDNSLNHHPLPSPLQADESPDAPVPPRGVRCHVVFCRLL